MDDENNSLQSELSSLVEEKEQLESSLTESLSTTKVQVANAKGVSHSLECVQVSSAFNRFGTVVRIK